MDAKPSLSPAFLTELAQAYTTLRPEALSHAFVSDLERTYSSLTTGPGVDFAFLAKHFGEWRQWALEQMRLYRKDLPRDDPLLCPISLFRTMDYGRLETAHTRTLAWLLDPRGEHEFGDKLLAALLRYLTTPDSFDTLSVERVEPEHPIKTGPANKRGRLDVFAEGEWRKGDNARFRWTLVIEAKIDAWEGDGQLAKYDAWLNRRTGEVVRVLLTPNARSAATGSEDWKRLSYIDLVRVFRGVYNELRNKEGFHFLRFYLAGVLQDVCGWPRHLTEDATDPYAVAAYLKSVHESLAEGILHDPTQ